jgi:tetratricopeptide (TPR) repeat protein
VAFKRNRWLVVSVLVVAVAAFLALSIIPLLGTRVDRQTADSNATAGQNGQVDAAELETRAQGYEMVLQREPDNQTALIGLIETRIQLGDIEGVIDPLGRLAELNPNETRYAVLLAQTKQQVGDLEGAAQSYRTVLNNNPGDVEALQGLVSLLLAQDRPQAAIGLLQDTLSTASQTNEAEAGAIDTTSVRLLLAEVYVESDRIDDALNLYDEAIDGAPEDFRPPLAKALVLQDRGDDDAAQPLFDQAISLAPDQYRDQVQQLAAGGDGLPPAPEAIPADPEGGAQPAPAPVPAE